MFGAIFSVLFSPLVDGLVENNNLVALSLKFGAGFFCAYRLISGATWSLDSCWVSVLREKCDLLHASHGDIGPKYRGDFGILRIRMDNWLRNLPVVAYLTDGHLDIYKWLCHLFILPYSLCTSFPNPKVLMPEGTSEGGKCPKIGL